ncbi:MAG TPA: FecR family protein [Polyangiaceae bacterium]|nr:FecR family protein [Polyangiaceae bacterium]
MIRDDCDHALVRALGRLGTAPVPVEDPAEVARRRARLMPDLANVAEREFSRRASRRAWALRGALALAAAAAAVAFFGMRSAGTATPLAGGASVLSGEGAVRVETGGTSVDGVGHGPLALKDRDRVETLEGHAEVRLVTGASVELERRTRLDLLAAARTRDTVDERVSLPSGRIRVRVPKLGAGSRLVVATPNADVTVHGTAFSVDVHPAERGGTETRVTVTEGLVSVASGGREVFLAPGASWSSSAAVPEAPAPTTEEAATRAPSAERVREAAPRKSTLSDENELFKSALAARRNGRPAETVALVNALLTRFPRSPLVAEARAEAERARADLARNEKP